MKKVIFTGLLLSLLAGCEDVNKLVDQAQVVANKAVDTVQEKMTTLDVSEINLEKFGEAASSATSLANSMQEALNVDLTNAEAIDQIKSNIANAYFCLVDASSESAAEELINGLLKSVQSEEAKSLIEGGVEKASSMKECLA